MHSHAHGPPPKTSQAMQRRLLWAVAPFIVFTVVGLVKLWPSGADLEVGAPGVGIRLDEGPDQGAEFSFNFSGGGNQRGFETGDKIIVTPTQTTEGVELPEDVPPYNFVDFQRRTPLLLLTAIFVLVVIPIARLDHHDVDIRGR